MMEHTKVTDNYYRMTQIKLSCHHYPEKKFINIKVNILNNYFVKNNVN